MFEIFFKYTPSIQEQQFIDIVDKLLQHPKTSIKMTPLTDKYFIINELKHYYIMLRENGIQITNSKFSFSKSLHPKAYSIIIKNLNNHLETNRQELENRLFVNETNMLNTVLNSL
jgi:hypothetical protein